MKKTKWIQGLLLGAIGFVSLGVAACNNETTKDDTFTGFTPGVATRIKRGEIVFLEEFIDYVAGSTYTIAISGGYLTEAEDLTNKERWDATYPGEYTITYTILEGENKGT